MELGLTGGSYANPKSWAGARWLQRHSSCVRHLSLACHQVRACLHEQQRRCHKLLPRGQIVIRHERFHDTFGDLQTQVDVSESGLCGDTP